MAAYGRLRSRTARGLRFVEHSSDGATLYHVAFADEAKPLRPRAPVLSFDDLDPPPKERASWAPLLLSLLAHGIFVLALMPLWTEDPQERQRRAPMEVSLFSAPGSAQADGPERSLARSRAEARPDGRQLAVTADGRPPAPSSPARPQQAELPASPASPQETATMDRPGTTSVAPVASASGQRSSEEDRWEGEMISHVSARRRYPPGALRQGLEDTVLLRIVIDRDGALLRAEIARSQGIALLDREVLALARRAAPYPKPPDMVDGDIISLVLPVEFRVRKAP